MCNHVSDSMSAVTHQRSVKIAEVIRKGDYNVPNSMTRNASRSRRREKKARDVEQRRRLRQEAQRADSAPAGSSWVGGLGGISNASRSQWAKRRGSSRFWAIPNQARAAGVVDMRAGVLNEPHRNGGFLVFWLGFGVCTSAFLVPVVLFGCLWGCLTHGGRASAASY